MKPTTLAFCSLCSALLPVAVQAQLVTNPRLVFTELSSTLLTATLDGEPFGSVLNVGPDNWEWRSGITGSEVLFSGNQAPPLIATWAEPGADPGVNLGIATTFDPLDDKGNIGFLLFSDFSPETDLGQVPANAAFGGNFTGLNGTATVFGPVDVYFNDLGDSAAVPESSYTLGLLALSGAAMFGAMRRFKPVSV